MMTQQNRLARERSPYLLQHQNNPVDWYPWGEPAFEKARKEDKPIFLSIGYSTCHWCHVMAHESFEDEDVAKLMNETFVSIKVDREERPDIDNIYMAVCQAMTGQGGWPLTIIMTPDAKPFYAATYIPRHSLHGRPGMMELIPRIDQVWHEQRAKVLTTADSVAAALQQAAAEKASGGELGVETLQTAYQQLAGRYDVEYGGFGNAPKFPTPHNLLFLLRYWNRSGEQAALEMVTNTLEKMRSGGVYDHAGYGFHRYATDRKWKLPHFEKMLYDQALLAMVYTEAFQVTKNITYEDTAREIFTYVLRDLTSPEGAFYSAEDADSEGREGKFYLWTVDELVELLAPEEFELVVNAYNVSPEGNFEEEATGRRTGENILYCEETLSDMAARMGLEPAVLQDRLDTVRTKLFEQRKKRVRPGLDDKILTDWNGLMIAAFAKAAWSFDEPAYAEAARRAADFLFSHLRDESGRLLHRYREGEAGIQANLDDYTFLTWGCIELYEATFETKWLRLALELTEEQIERFWDDERGGFFFTPEDGEALIVRQKELYDGAIPSGNSIAMLNLLRLGRMTGNMQLEQMADAIGSYAYDKVMQFPSAYNALLLAVDFMAGPAKEIVIAGERDDHTTQEMFDIIRSRYLPSSVVLLKEPGDPLMDELSPFVGEQQMLDGRTTAYICRNFACERPTTDLEVFKNALDT